MTSSFKSWLATQGPLTPSMVVEVSALFDRDGVNSLFAQELRQLRQKFPDRHKQLMMPVHFDWVAYVAKSLRSDGFKNHDIDPLTHEIVVRLLIAPGGLFRNWDGQPIDARFKLAVRNAVLNFVQKRRTEWKRLSHGSTGHGLDSVAAVRPQTSTMSGASESDAIHTFRELVSERLGPFARALLDVRLAGGTAKSLTDATNLGKPSAYRLKLAVQAIKKLAEEFAQQRRDEAFLWQMRRAMAAEDDIIQRRVAGNRAAKQVIA